MRAILPPSPPVPSSPADAAPPALTWGDWPEPEAGPGDVVLRVVATAVNRADLLQVRGHYPPPPGASPILGLEAAGYVERVGAAVSGFTPGQPAMALLAGGGYAERVVVDARHLLPVPPGLELVAAAAIPEVFVTAWLNLFRLGRLAPGERVLIHGGSGGVGTAAIQLACARGAVVYATAGGAERCRRCVALGATAAFDHRDAAVDFAAAMQDEGGVDVVLDVMGAKLLERNLRALAPGGRLVVIGLQGGRKAEIDLGRVLAARLTVVGSTLRGRDADDKAALLAGFAREVLPLFDAGRVRPIIDRILPLPEVEVAHGLLARGEVFGKVVLAVPPAGTGPQNAE